MDLFKQKRKLILKLFSNYLIVTYEKNILTISDLRGFAQKGGIIQIYSMSQKLKLNINLQKAQKENIKIISLQDTRF